jgi:hypothetical protein
MNDFYRMTIRAFVEGLEFNTIKMVAGAASAGIPLMLALESMKHLGAFMPMV